MKEDFALKMVILVALVITSESDAVLSNLPITFQMSGTTTYLPDSGGSTQNGYFLTLGFAGNSWLAVQFVTGMTNDVLVLQINDFYTSNANPIFSGHQVTVQDYFSNSSGLYADTITTYDISAFAYFSTKKYSLTLTRYLGSNSGQDWDASTLKYSIQKICFYTSGYSFNPKTYTSFSSVCQYFEINSLVSTFVGPLLKSFMLNGYQTQIYGWIDGPLLKNKVFLYQQVPLFTYVQIPAVILEIGTTTGGVGQDFYAYSPISSETGDYFGSSVTTMTKDNSASGFQHSGVTLNHWNAVPAQQIAGLSTTSLRINFTRLIYTYDAYDKQMLSTFIFCAYIYVQGSISSALSDKSCEMVELSPSYLIMALGSGSSYGEIPVLTWILIAGTIMLGFS